MCSIGSNLHAVLASDFLVDPCANHHLQYNHGLLGRDREREIEDRRVSVLTLREWVQSLNETVEVI